MSYTTEERNRVLNQLHGDLSAQLAQFQDLAGIKTPDFTRPATLAQFSSQAAEAIEFLVQ